MRNERERSRFPNRVRASAWLAITVIIIVVGSSCGSEPRTGVGADPTPAEPSPSETSSSGGSDGCEADLTFDLTYLPEGFSHEPRPGPAPTAPTAQDGQAVVYYAAGEDRFIEIRRPGTLFTELALADDAPTIDVLGTPTPNFAPREPAGDDFIVQFQYEGDMAPSSCTNYSLDEYGVPLDELKRVAEGLRAE